MEDKKYPELTDLGIGAYNLKVWPAKAYDEEKGAYIEGSHKQGGEGGNKWWMYQAKVDGVYYNLFANNKNTKGATKADFDSGKVQVRIKAKELDGEEIVLKVVGEDGKVSYRPKLIHFINEYKGGAMHGEAKKEPVEEEQPPMSDDDIPF